MNNAAKQIKKCLEFVSVYNELYVREKRKQKKGNFMQRHNPTTEQRNNVELCYIFFFISITHLPSDHHTRLPLPVFILRPTEM